MWVGGFFKIHISPSTTGECCRVRMNKLADFLQSKKPQIFCRAFSQFFFSFIFIDFVSIPARLHPNAHSHTGLEFAPPSLQLQRHICDDSCNLYSHVFPERSRGAIAQSGHRVLTFFSSRPNWDSPSPSPASECALPPPPPGPKGGGGEGGRGYTRLRPRGWGSPNSNDWRKS